MPKKSRQMPPVHPGEVLKEDLMKPLSLSVNALATELKIRDLEIAGYRKWQAQLVCGYSIALSTLLWQHS